MHCHIGWHTSEGMAVQFIERPHEIESVIDTKLVADTCAAWETYASANHVEEEHESGV